LLSAPAVPQPINLSPAIRITCQYIATDRPQSALPEISVESDQGPAQLLCGGRYLRWMDTDYVVEETSQLSAALTARPDGSETTRTYPTQLVSAA
jgi:hypothetical protein